MRAVFAGTFDPFTLGHRDIVERALGVFGRVTVAVAAVTGKSTASLEKRKEIAEQSLVGLDGADVVTFDGALCDFLGMCGDCVLVRGVRNSRDLEYERDHCRIYKSLCGKDAVCFITSAEYEHVSSTAVRELAALGCSLDGYVPVGAMKTVVGVYGKNK